jgi:hypothetical protein
MEAAALQQSLIEHQAGSQGNSKTEADYAMQEARVTVMQEQEAATFQRYRSEQEVSRVNMCGCCVWWECLVHMQYDRHVLVKSSWVLHMVGRMHLCNMSIPEHSSLGIDPIS